MVDFVWMESQFIKRMAILTFKHKVWSLNFMLINFERLSFFIKISQGLKVVLLNESSFTETSWTMVSSGALLRKSNFFDVAKVRKKGHNRSLLFIYQAFIWHSPLIFVHIPRFIYKKHCLAIQEIPAQEIVCIIK